MGLAAFQTTLEQLHQDAAALNKNELNATYGSGQSLQRALCSMQSWGWGGTVLVVCRKRSTSGSVGLFDVALVADELEVAKFLSGK